MSRTKQELLQASNQVKKETQEGANTADRVGGILYDITEHIQDVAITPKLSGGTEIAEYTINGEKKSLYAPDGGGGGGGTSGVQKAYFLNIAHGVTPSIPSVNEYNAANNTFKHGSDIWLANNVNPSNYQDTWMMWAWFVNNAPTSIGGATKIYDSTQGGGGGTNGQDGEEIEWIYFRYNFEIDWTSQQWSPVTRDLHNYHGTTRITDTESFGGTTWYNHPQGIELNNKYEYASFRVSGYALDGKTRVWGATGFSDPILWSAYGKQGLDGDGVEYIFFADPSGTAPVGAKNRPETWTNDADFQTDEYIRSGSDWEDNPIDLDSAAYGPGSKQWVSVRKKKIVSPYTEPRWQAYSEPALWSGVGLDGVVDGYTVSTDNPTMLVTTDSEGTVDSFTDSTTYEVFHNGTRVDYTDDPTQASTHFMLSVGTITPAISGISAVPASGGKITVTLTNVTNFDGVNVAIPVVVHLPNGDTRNSKITVTGFAASEGGMAVSLYTGASNIRTDYYEQNVVPASLPIGVREGKGENPTVYYSGAGAEDRGYHFRYFYDTAGTHIDQSGPITVATNHSSLTVELYKDSGETFLESLTLPYVKDGAPGIGIAAVNYSIAVLSTSVALKDNNVSGEISFKVIKVKGGESPIEITTSPFNGTGGDGETIHVIINGTTKTATYSSAGYWVVSHNDTYNSSYPFSQIYVMSATSMLLASTTIPIIRDGDSSVQGLNAVVMRFRSYDAIISGSTAECGDGYGDIQNGTTPYTDGVIYKDIICFDGADGDNSYYYVVPSNTETHDRYWALQYKPASFNPYQVNTQHGWQHFTDMGDASFQALLAKYAFVENLTAREIVVTDTTGHPVAGMTQGTAVAGDYTASLVPQNVRGNVRIWAGYDSTTGNLTNSKFYVTEEGFVHAENAEIEGEVTATSGTIGGYTIHSDKLQATSDGQTVTIQPSDISFTKGVSGLAMTATKLSAYNGYVEIMGGNEDHYGSLYVGGNAYTRSLTIGVDADIDNLSVNRCAFIYSAGGTLTLPNDAPTGSLFFVKSYYAPLTVNCGIGYLIMNPGNTEKVSAMNIGGESCIFIKANSSTWVAFYCG